MPLIVALAMFEQLDTSRLFGRPTLLVSYPTSSCIADLLGAAQSGLGRAAASAAASAPPAAFAWVDGFCASPHASASELHAQVMSPDEH